MVDEESRLSRELGTPQGGVMSPLLANIYLHFAFDKWLEQHHQWIRFERYADDIVIHCKSERQAKYIKDVVSKRLAEVKLKINESKTQIVYCRSENHREHHKRVSFDFLT